MESYPGGLSCQPAVPTQWDCGWERRGRLERIKALVGRGGTPTDRSTACSPAEPEGGAQTHPSPGWAGRRWLGCPYSGPCRAGCFSDPCLSSAGPDVLPLIVPSARPLPIRLRRQCSRHGSSHPTVEARDTPLLPECACACTGGHFHSCRLVSSPDTWTHAHTHTHTCTQGHTHTWTHVRTRTHTAALRRVLLHLEDLGASKAPSCREGPRAGPDLAPSGSPGPQPGPAPWGADSAGGPSSATRSGLWPHKGAGPWPCGGGAGPVGTDLPGPGGGAGTERPRGAASLGLQQRGQRRRRGAGACFTGQESPGWGFRPPQAGPTPTPHLLGGLVWALPPQSVPVGRGSPPPPQRLRAQPGRGRGSRVPSPQPWAAAGLEGGAQPCLGARSRQMTRGPSRADGQRGRARWRADPGSA